MQVFAQTSTCTSAWTKIVQVPFLKAIPLKNRKKLLLSCGHLLANVKNNIGIEYSVENLLAETLLKDWLKEKDRNGRVVNKSELYKDSWLG